MPAMAHILYSVHSTHWPHFNPLRIFVHNMPAMANIPYSVHSTHWPHFNPLRIPFGFISMLALPLRFAFSTGNLFCQLCNLYSPAHCKEHWREHTVTNFFFKTISYEYVLLRASIKIIQLISEKSNIFLWLRLQWKIFIQRGRGRGVIEKCYLCS